MREREPWREEGEAREWEAIWKERDGEDVSEESVDAGGESGVCGVEECEGESGESDECGKRRSGF